MHTSARSVSAKIPLPIIVLAFHLVPQGLHESERYHKLGESSQYGKREGKARIVKLSAKKAQPESLKLRPLFVILRSLFHDANHSIRV